MLMRRVLSIDGGGIRGLIPAVVCQKLEEWSGQTISSLFDLIRDIREEAPYLVQYEDGPNRTYIEAQAVEAMIRIVPKIELPSDHH